MTTTEERKAHLINAMAKDAHEAWMAAYKEQGLTSRKAEWGEEFMVPFDELSERGQDLDRTIMRSLLTTLDELGYDVLLRPQRGSVKVLNLDEFRSLGFFQEANRMFFHPLGLALEVMEDDDGHITNISGIWDYRDDPEGIAYGRDRDGNEMIDANKAENVRAEREAHKPAREALWGNTIQPVPES